MGRINIYTYILTLLVLVALAYSTELRSENVEGNGYWVPKKPPKAHYKIDCSIDESGQLLEGSEVISFTNDTPRPINQLAVKWLRQGGETLDITSKGKGVSYLTDANSSRVVFKLPEAIKPSDNGSIEIKFSGVKPAQTLNNKIGFVSWHPQLDWGFETHADYDVKINAPLEYTVLTSGVFDDSVARYQAQGVKSFIVILCKEHKVMEANAKDVVVRCVYTSKGEKCARLIVDTAVDAVNFYRERFGFYPYCILTIIPGMNHPAGGYPVAPCVVAIHGMEQFDSMPKLHWQWITAHEIGHQYWGEYVLSKNPSDSLDWLMIGLGIYADREYTCARGLGSEKHQGLMNRYIEGVRAGFDTTMNITPEQRSKVVQFDFNNVVEHGKSYSFISALDCVLGKKVSSRIYQRCLKEFGGRRLGVHEFRAVCEEESQQDLGWFFDQWVNSNRYLSYEISNKKCTKHGKRYITEVEVKCLGDLKMPVPVAAYYEDGSSEVKFTSRLLETNTLEFISDSPLKEVKLDAENELALIVPPPSGDSKVLGEILQLPWSSAGDKALELYKKAKQLEAESEVWYKLGLNLYDGKHYTEALEAFRSIITAPDKAAEGEFMSLVWQGHLLDIFERRAEALQCYRKALDVHTKAGLNDFKVCHDQYKMVINRAWVEERIEKPFVRESSKKDETKQAVSNLKVLDIEFEPIHQGKNAVRVKVKNISEQDQTFGIHIQSRAGGGWGRPFFETIKGNMTTWMHFAFKIRGAIGKDAYVRLQFYNPASADEFDFEKWFKKIMYSYKDFERFGIDEEPLKAASKDQTKLITQHFRKMQDDIRNEKYQEAWQLFTNDYQREEFSNSFETFVEVMSLYKVKFLALEPNSITVKDKVLTLTATSKFLTLVTEFVQIEKQWKIKWMRATAEGDWKEHLLPNMQKRVTKHFDIYYFKDSTAEKQIDKIVKQREKGFEEICRFLGKDSDVRICMVFFEDGKTKQFETGHTGAGWAYGTTIVEIYNEEQKLDPYHETIHILMGSFGNPPALFNEGFAVYMSERLEAHGLEDSGGGQSTIYERVRELKAKGEWIDLEELITYTEIGSKKSRPPVAYPEAASFVKFLIDKYGKDKFLEAYKTLRNYDGRIVQQQNIETLERVYNKSLAELEKDWEIAFRWGD